MNGEGTLKIEHVKDGEVVKEFVCKNPISDKGIDCLIDVVPSDRAFRHELPRTLTLENGKQKAIIDFGGDEVTYSGDLPVDESAKLFFNAVFGHMQPKTCRTCCWYKQDRDCSCPKMVYGYFQDLEIDNDGIQIEDDEGWGMSPEPGFGCIHHKEKS